jgi:hypothetical protein
MNSGTDRYEVRSLNRVSWAERAVRGVEEGT